MTLYLLIHNNAPTMKRNIFLLMAVTALLPLAAQADIISLQPLSAIVAPATPSTPPAPPSPLSCFDFRSTLRMGSNNYEVRALQFALMSEGWTIAVPEYGTFGPDTLAAVNGFQEKYSNDILKDIPSPTGIVGRATRAKLNSIYGCNVPMALVTPTPTPTAMPPAIPSSVILIVKNVSLDGNGVTVNVCNQSPTDIPVFPVRVRLNGIVRDFSIPSATKAGACDTDTIPYAAWGLTYDPGSTYGVVTALDPNGMYKTAQATYPLNGTTTLSIPVIQGAHLSVRGITIKSNGLQGTLCNLGTTDLATYPVRVTVNGTSKDIDVPGVHTHGQCQTVTWTYDMFNMTPNSGTVIAGIINVDPNNVIQETNEFDNSATIVGTI
jgi:hypothetical protein